MPFLYTIIIRLYRLLIGAAAPFNAKAALWVRGRRTVFRQLEDDLRDRPRVIWFHAASLGEFEQGRPVMEAFRQRHPGIRILLTFFSPSGYEVRKDYPGADHIHYLPIDTPENARRFVQLVNPVAAVFIKYEFWFNYLDQLHRKGIPTYTISAIFRPGQHFFRPWGGWALRQLRKVTLFFVQNEASGRLLREAGIDNFVVSGDTRFDRVMQIAAQKKDFPLIAGFAAGAQVVLAGSSWPPEERLVLRWLDGQRTGAKVIIAPHEVHEERIRAIAQAYAGHAPVRYSQLKDERDLEGARVLIVDGMGFLSGLYQYCDAALIGGGFGKGIHNILEAVTFGKPVLFGPNYQKFAEAVELAEKGGAFPVEEEDFEVRVNKLLDDKELYDQASGICRGFIAEHTGATAIILDNIRLK